MDDTLETIKSPPELVVLCSSDVFFAKEIVENLILYEWGGNGLHWLEFVPLALVLLITADTWPTRMLSSKKVVDCNEGA